MMREFILDWGLFEPRCGDRTGWSESTLKILLEAMVKVNRLYIRCMNPPKLYNSGVRYIREPPGREEWMAIGAILRDGGADCEDLSAWRVAELQEQGESARTLLTKKTLRGGTLLYHVRVIRGDGRVEDPSRRLGMGWERKFLAMRKQGIKKPWKFYSRSAFSG